LLKTNKHGLSRYIPEPVRREIRRRAGFGCVVCGRAIGDYDHLDPAFEDPRIHHPDAIVFLCIGCHGLKTRGRFSAQRVRNHARKHAALQKGFSFGVFDMLSNRPALHIASNTAENCPNFFRLDGLPVLSIKPPNPLAVPSAFPPISLIERERCSRFHS
jgi:hypothetical protein